MTIVVAFVIAAALVVISAAVGFITGLVIHEMSKDKDEN